MPEITFEDHVFDIFDKEKNRGIANGHTAEQQEMLCIEALKGKVSI
jgi:hypothetical protein